MKLKGLGSYKNINSFVTAKTNEISINNKSYKNFYDFMFSEKENPMFEYDVERRKTIKTYGEIYEEINDLSLKLNTLLKGYKKDSLIGLYLDNSIEFIELFWCILKCGYNPLLMNVRLDNERLKEVSKENDVKVVISRKEIDLGIKNITVSEIYNSEKTEINNDFGNYIVFMSSGTSGSVKLCFYGPEQFAAQLSNSESIVKECSQITKNYEGEIKLLTFLPFYHIFGFIAVYLWFAFFARTFVLLPKIDKDTIFSTIKKHKVTHIFAVPLLWTMIYDGAIKKIKSDEKLYKKFVLGLKISNNKRVNNHFTKSKFEVVRSKIFGNSPMFLISGGSYISPEVVQFFNGIGYHFAVGYGMSEVGVSSVETNCKKKILNTATIGKPLKSFEYKINENGELLIKGSEMASKIVIGGKEIEHDEWLNSHDIAEEKNGHYYILGRKDDMIALPNGENLNTNYVESNLKLSGVVDVALINCDALTLIVQVSSYLSNSRLVEIRQSILNKISQLKFESAIKNVVFTTKSLLGNDFKLNHSKILKRFKDGEFNEVDVDLNSKDASLNSDLVSKITNYFKETLNIDREISVNDNFFFDLEGTSLDYFSMVSKIEEEFSIDFPSYDETSLSTIKEFCDYIDKNI